MSGPCSQESRKRITIREKANQRMQIEEGNSYRKLRKKNARKNKHDINPQAPP